MYFLVSNQTRNVYYINMKYKFIQVLYSPEFPPVAVVCIFRREPFEHVPPPQIHQISERQKYYLI